MMDSIVIVCSVNSCVKEMKEETRVRTAAFICWKKIGPRRHGHFLVASKHVMEGRDRPAEKCKSLATAETKGHDVVSETRPRDVLSVIWNGQRGCFAVFSVPARVAVKSDVAHM